VSEASDEESKGVVKPTLESSSGEEEASNSEQEEQDLELEEESEREEEPEEGRRVIKIHARPRGPTNAYETNSEWDSDISQIPAKLPRVNEARQSPLKLEAREEESASGDEETEEELGSGEQEEQESESEGDEEESEEEPEERGRVVKIPSRPRDKAHSPLQLEAREDEIPPGDEQTNDTDEIDANVEESITDNDNMKHTSFDDGDISAQLNEQLTQESQASALRGRSERTLRSEKAPTQPRSSFSTSRFQLEEKEEEQAEAVQRSKPPTSSKRRKVTATMSASTASRPEEVGEDEDAEIGVVSTDSNAKKRKRAAAPTTKPTPKSRQAATNRPSASASSQPRRIARRTLDPSKRKQGPFDSDEEARLIAAITEFIHSHNITAHRMEQIVTRKDPSDDGLIILGEFWNAVAPAFPERRAKDLKEMIERKFQIYKSNKKWMPEDDERLCELAEQYTGDRRWIEIGSIMDRYADACRDRYRNYASCGLNRQRGLWNDKELGKMFDALASFVPPGLVEAVKVEMSPEEETVNFTFAPDWMKVSQMMDGMRSRQQCLFKWNNLNVNIQRPKVLRLLCGWQPELTASLRACRMQIYSMRDVDVLHIIRAVANHVPGKRERTRIRWKKVEEGTLTDQWPVSTLRIVWRRLRRSLLPGSPSLLNQEAAMRMVSIAESEGLGKFWGDGGDKSAEQRIVEGEDVEVEGAEPRRRGRPKKERASLKVEEVSD